MPVRVSVRNERQRLIYAKVIPVAQIRSASEAPPHEVEVLKVEPRRGEVAAAQVFVDDVHRRVRWEMKLAGMAPHDKDEIIADGHEARRSPLPVVVRGERLVGDKGGSEPNGGGVDKLPSPAGIHLPGHAQWTEDVTHRRAEVFGR